MCGGRVLFEMHKGELPVAYWFVDGSRFYMLGRGEGAYCCVLASVVPSVWEVSNQRVKYGVALYG